MNSTVLGGISELARLVTFNAYGWRVYNSGGPVSYLLDPSGRFLGGRWNGGGNSAIFLGSRMLAEYQSNGVDFAHVNVLGSDTQMTDYAGNGGQPILYYAWGQVWSNPAGLDPNTFYQRYASLLHYDAATDSYVPPFRYYIPEQGRWLTPDPLAGNILNPQSLNRYAYVGNNPTSFIDPGGLCPNCGNNPPPGINIGCSNALDMWGCVHQKYCDSLYCGFNELLGPDPFDLQLFTVCNGGECGTNFDPNGATVANGLLLAEGPNQQSEPCGNAGRGGGLGITYGGSADLGYVFGGATATGSAGGGLFYDSKTGASGGAMAGGGAAAYFSIAQAGVPAQTGQVLNTGTYAGAGPNIFVTNARSVQQLQGPFTTISLNVGSGPVKFSAQYSFGGGIWQLSVGPPIPYVSAATGVSISKVTTKTVTTKTGCGPG